MNGLRKVESERNQAIEALRRRRWGVAALLIATMSVQAQAESPLERFIATLDERTSTPPDARGVITSAWETCRVDPECDHEELLIQGLTLVSPKFREGLDAYDADDYDRASQLLNALRRDPDPFVAANAAAFSIKALVQGERLLEALTYIDEALADGGSRLAAYTFLAPEIEFLRGYCLLADVRYDEAAQALESFLSKYPDASQRLTISAQQMLLELRNRQPERIGEVADLMTFCGRRLALADAGDKVQERQERIVELLDRMIEEAEQKEKNSQSAGGSSSGDSGSRSPQNPMEESTLPGGSGPSDGPMRAARRANPGEVWGAMPPAERERVLQALRDSFPQKYRRLVEQYYEDLAKTP